MNELYTTWIETPSGRILATYSDTEVERIGGLALMLRDLRREGGQVAPSEIAAAAFRHEELEASHLEAHA